MVNNHLSEELKWHEKWIKNVKMLSTTVVECHLTLCSFTQQLLWKDFTWSPLNIRYSPNKYINKYFRVPEGFHLRFSSAWVTLTSPFWTRSWKEPSVIVKVMMYSQTEPASSCKVDRRQNRIKKSFYLQEYSETSKTLKFHLLAKTKNRNLCQVCHSASKNSLILFNIQIFTAIQH